MPIDVMLLFWEILLGLFSGRISYKVIAYNVAKGIEENLERGAFMSTDPMVIICENTFRVIKPQNPLRELLPTIPQRVLWKTFRGVLMSKGLMAFIFEATDCSGIPVKVLWKTSKTFRDGLWFPSTMLNFIVYLDSIVNNDFLAIFPC